MMGIMAMSGVLSKDRRSLFTIGEISLKFLLPKRRILVGRRGMFLYKLLKGDGKARYERFLALNQTALF
jgi:hypothetical protein